MLRWFKRLIRRWVIDDDPTDKYLDCIVDGEPGRWLIIGSEGMMLRGLRPRGLNRLIGAGQAVDQPRFWRLWERYNEGGLRWEDGTEWVPPV